MAASTKKKSKKKKLQLQSEADLQVERDIKRRMIKRIVFWSIYLGGLFLLLITALSGALVGTNVWASLILLVPFILLVAPIIYARTQPVARAEIVTRTLVVLVAMVLFWIGLFLVIMIGAADFLWALVAGNATMGTAGLLAFIPGVGQLLSMGLAFALALVLPVWLTVRLVRELSQVEINLFEVLLLAFLTPLGFVFLIGLSIINNSGL